MGMIMGLLGILIAVGFLALVVLGIVVVIRRFMPDISNSDAGGQVKKILSGDSLIMRLMLAVLLVILSLIPLQLVASLVHDRGALYQQVAERMTQEWAGAQTISGPVLTIPYEYTDVVLDKIENRNTGAIQHIEREVTRVKNLHILPESLTIESNLETRELSRGIYSVPIYESRQTLSGHFKWLDTSILQNPPEMLLWDKAFVTFMMSSTEGIQDQTQMIWNGQNINLSSGTAINGLPYQGIHARIKLSDAFMSESYDFELTLNLRGSQSISFAPTARNSVVMLSADWAHPSFQGQMLPAERHITEDMFTAQWRVPHLSRNYEQLTALPDSRSTVLFEQIATFHFGSDLFQSVNLYTLLDRTVKYGVMFVALTFITIFILEFAIGRRLHWLQHLMIGGGLSMFYLCVLAFSEHMAFAHAYMIGAGLMTVILGAYTLATMRSVAGGAGVAGMIISLYTILFSILQMEDYALLIGTLLLLGFLILGMIVTRRLNHTEA